MPEKWKGATHLNRPGQKVYRKVNCATRPLPNFLASRHAVINTGAFHHLILCWRYPNKKMHVHPRSCLLGKITSSSFSLTVLILYLPNTLFLSITFKPKAKIIFRCVSILHGMPCSIRETVMGDIPAFLASSVLLISKDSLIFFNRFLLILKILLLCYFVFIMLLRVTWSGSIGLHAMIPESSQILMISV